MIEEEIIVIEPETEEEIIIIENDVEYISPTTQEKTINPTLERQEVFPDDGIFALSKVTVEAVTNDIDNNIIPENIKGGVTILGVQGNLNPLIPDELNVTPTKETQEFTPLAPKTGYTSVIVNPIPDEYVVTEGTLKITENGTYDVTNYSNAEVKTSGVDISQYFNTVPQVASSSSNPYVANNYIIKLPEITIPNTYNSMQYFYYNWVFDIFPNIIFGNNVTSLNYLYYQNKKLTELKLEDTLGWNTENVTSMSNMFYQCTQLTYCDLSNLNTSKVTNTSAMFYGTALLETLIINSPYLLRMSARTMFTASKIAVGTGYVYVPDDMVDTYKNATNWSNYADQIKGISELEGYNA